MHKGNDSVRCIYNDGDAIWEGKEYLLDCVENYCLLPSPPPSNAILARLVKETTSSEIPANEITDERFGDHAILSYKCKPGFTFYGTDSFNMTCNISTTTSNYGEWIPRNSDCRGIFLAFGGLLLGVISGINSQSHEKE